MSPFSFKTDAQSRQYCKDIVKVLVGIYDFSQSEALALLNRGWKGQDFVGKRDLRYHKGRPEDWARHIAANWRH